MTIDDLIEMWGKDSSISGEDYDIYSKKISILHAKYLGLRIKHKIATHKKQEVFNLEHEWWNSYYNGEFNTNSVELAKNGLEPCQGPITQAKINNLLKVNEKLRKIKMDIVIHEQITYFCDQVIQELKQRSYSLGNAIKWKIWSSGS